MQDAQVTKSLIKKKVIKTQYSTRKTFYLIGQYAGLVIYVSYFISELAHVSRAPTCQKWGSCVKALSGVQMSRNGEADCQRRTASTKLKLP